MSDASVVSEFAVLDPDINFSDHLPLLAVLSFSYCSDTDTVVQSPNKSGNIMLPQLRWDKANRDLYYQYTGLYLVPIFAIVDDMSFDYKAGHVTVDCVHNCIESCYESIIYIFVYVFSCVGHYCLCTVCLSVLFLFFYCTFTTFVVNKRIHYINLELCCQYVCT